MESNSIYDHFRYRFNSPDPEVVIKKMYLPIWYFKHSVRLLRIIALNKEKIKSAFNCSFDVSHNPDMVIKPQSQ